MTPPTTRSPSGRSSASTPSASRSHGRAWRPTPAATTPPPGFDAGRPRRARGYHWGVIDAAVDRLVARGDRADPHARRAAAAVGLGQPEPRQPALPAGAPAFGAFAAAVAQRYGDASTTTSSGTSRTCRCGSSRRPAARKKRCSPVVARHLPRDGPRRLPGDPRRRPGRHGAHRRARARRRRPQEPQRQHAPADVPARARLPRRQAAPGHRPAAAEASSPRSPTASPTTRTARATPPDQPFATADNADLASLLADRAPARPHAALGPDPGSTTPLGIWLDEYGYQTNPPDKLRGVSPGRQDRYLQQAAYLRLARSARPAALAVPVGRRAGRRRQALHRLAVGPALRRRPAQARARALRPPDVAGLREQHAVGAGPARRRPRRPGPGPRRGRRDPVAARGRRHDRRGRPLVAAHHADPLRVLSLRRRRRGGQRRDGRRPAAAAVDRRADARAGHGPGHRSPDRVDEARRGGPAVVRGDVDRVLGGARLHRLGRQGQRDLRPPGPDPRSRRARRRRRCASAATRPTRRGGTRPGRRAR